MTTADGYDEYHPKTGDTADILFYKKVNASTPAWYYLIRNTFNDTVILREGDGAELRNKGSGIGRVFMDVKNAELRWSE